MKAKDQVQSVARRQSRAIGLEIDDRARNQIKDIHQRNQVRYAIQTKLEVPAWRHVGREVRAPVLDRLNEYSEYAAI